eukprot:Phypoly_transcript_28812.p1 GENE.Phypoly_transcript_28812~~Phypoly_transcript_28812.p1  ORF type:complete len:123 (+),score=24.95 Phypoly_transcript_28812:49-417(+)
MAAVEVHTQEELDALITKHDVVIAFMYLSSFQSCLLFAEKFARIARTHPNITFAQVFSDEIPSLNRENGNKMKVYKNGKCVQNAKAELDWDAPSSEKDAVAAERLLMTLVKKYGKKSGCVIC